MAKSKTNSRSKKAAGKVKAAAKKIKVGSRKSSGSITKAAAKAPLRTAKAAPVSTDIRRGYMKSLLGDYLSAAPIAVQNKKKSR